MLKQVDIKDAKYRGGIVLLVCASRGDKRKKGRMSVERLKVSSTMVKRAFAFTFTQHAGDCERYSGQAGNYAFSAISWESLPLSNAQGRMPRAPAGDFFLNVFFFINSTQYSVLDVGRGDAICG